MSLPGLRALFLQAFLGRVAGTAFRIDPAWESASLPVSRRLGVSLLMVVVVMAICCALHLAVTREHGPSLGRCGEMTEVLWTHWPFVIVLFA